MYELYNAKQVHKFDNIGPKFGLKIQTLSVAVQKMKKDKYFWKKGGFLGCLMIKCGEITITIYHRRYIERKQTFTKNKRTRI